MTSEFIVNHLWQSSCFALVAGLLAFVLRKNSPKVRYWVWLSASLKFLAPFALLVSLGSAIPRPAQRAVSVAVPVFSNTLVEVAEPFAAPAYPSAPVQGSMRVAPIVIGLVWGLGFSVVAFVRWRAWLRIRAALRAGRRVELPVPIRAFITSGAGEPGIVGILRPVLVLPAMLLEQLDPRQVGAVLAHEMCHVRRRDNLFAAVHMVVETIFWFNPLVWWIGSRMMEERELACDEEVLRMGSDPTDYVEGILKVCRLYAESSLACISGVTGANVKKRLRAILAGSIARELSVGRKTALAMILFAAVAVPVVVGVLKPPQVHAQSPQPVVVPSAQKEAAGPSVAQVAAPKEEPTQRAGQTAQPTAAPLQFEIASVKPVDPNVTCCYPPQIDQGMFTYRTALYNLIGQAYRAFFSCPSKTNSGECAFPGAPEWIYKDRFAIEARLPEGFPAFSRQQFMRGRAPQLNQMLQALLENRFKLKVHWESRTVPVYALTVDKSGPKLKPAAGPIETRPDAMSMNLTSREPNGNIRTTETFKDSSMQDFANSFSDFMDRPVIDRTGLKGNFDFTFAWESEPDEPTNGDSSNVGRALHPGPAMFAAIQEQLGLKLEATRGPVNVLVIDHVEQPSED